MLGNTGASSGNYKGMTPTPSPYADATDAQLIHAARNEPAAFEALFVRHALALRRMLFAQTKDLAVANDLLSETFARAWLASRRFRGDSEHSGRAWLFGIGRNLVLQHYRHGRVEQSARKRLRLGEDTTNDGGIDSSIDRVDALAALPATREAFAELGEDQQLAIGYRVIAGLSYAEVASQLGCEPVTARTRVHRGLRNLRAALEKESRNG